MRLAALVEADGADFCHTPPKAASWALIGPRAPMCRDCAGQAGPA